jgi:hypothetical protein
VTSEQLSNAKEIDKLALAMGFTGEQRQELIGAAYKESGLSENAKNASGAFGLFQLLSAGYQKTYNQLVGQGASPVDANIETILPAYQQYWQQHATAGAGAAAAAVEASGEPASWYAQGYQNFLNIGGGAYYDYASPQATDAASADLTSVPGVKQAGQILGSISSVGDAIAFLFSLRFLEILAGGALVIIALVSLAKGSGTVKIINQLAPKGEVDARGRSVTRMKMADG